MKAGKCSVANGPVLILGGTSEAREIAARLEGLGVEVISSLAGRTAHPYLPLGKVRIGGFGGAEGLAAYLLAHHIGLLIDATHPFAAQISHNAAQAAQDAGVPIVRLTRTAWAPPSDGAWRMAPDFDTAAALLPAGTKVFLAVGRQQLARFAQRSDCRFVARVIDAPSSLPPEWTLIKARGPFTEEAERALFTGHSITHLVTKNSGGTMGAKLAAARDLGIEIIMIERPQLPTVRSFPSVDALLANLRD